MASPESSSENDLTVPRGQRSPQSPELQDFAPGPAKEGPKKIPRKTKGGSVGRRVLDSLCRLGCRGAGQGDIYAWLIGRGVPVLEAEKFSHTVSQWRGGGPSVASLTRLADLAKLSLDDLLGRAQRGSSSDDVFVPGQGWFADFLSKSRHIRCYVVSMDAAALQETREEAAVATAPNVTVEQKVRLARGWSERFRVRDASRRMRDEHHLDDPLDAYTLAYLLEARMRWTQEVQPDGAKLAKLATHQAYLGIFEALGHHRMPTFNRFPCMYYDEEGRSWLESLRVGSDQIPKAVEPSWVIYYHWGPPISQSDLEKRLAEADLLP